PLAVNATFLGIYNTANSASLNISFNRIQNNSTAGYGGNTYLIVSSAGVSSLVTIANNTVGFAFNGATSFTATHYGIYNNATTSTGSVVLQNNIYNALQYSVTASGPTYLFLNSGIPARVLMSGNLINNLNINSSGTFVGFYNNASTQSLSIIQSNTLANVNFSSPHGTFYGYLGNGNVPAGSTHSIIQNVFSNITSTIASGNAVYVLYSNENSGIPYPLKTIASNSISTIQFNSSAAMYPMLLNYLGDGNQNTSSVIQANTINNIRNNTTIYGIQVSANTSPAFPVMVSTNTISGLYTNLNGASILGAYLLSGSASAGLHFFRNRIFDLNVNGTASAVYGLYTGATSTTNIYNNLISQLSATAASGLNRINGVYVAAGNVINLWYNSISLSGTSSGINFGTNALYVNTASNVQLINNILVNNCIPTGTGISCAYRRSNANLSTYQLNSNSNLFYAGVPAVNRILYSDGTINLQSLAATQSTLNPRDLQSVTENPNFISVLGANANFLNINPLLPTQIESGATALAHVTTDCILTSRNPSSPDIGAWEGNFTALTTCSGMPLGGTAIISSSIGCPNVQFLLNVTGNSSGSGISYQWQSANSPLGPWNSINGALSSFFTSSVNASTYFRLMVSCANSSISAFSSIVSYSVNNPGPCICNAYQNSAAALNTDEDILEVTIANLSVVSTCTTTAPGAGSIPNQYSNYAGTVGAASLIAGQNYNFTVQVGTCGGAFPNALACYIDLNQNGILNDPGEQVYLSPASTNGPHLETGTITIPANATTGITRMRWVLNETPTPAVITATGSYALGETEDYCAQILA
ncbi:MAG: GEVED domain-containing protein, partial [Bacteroidia bacterium]